MNTPPDGSPSLSLVLFAAARALDESAQTVVNEQLGEVVARPALMRILPWLEAGPSRVTEIAKRVDVTKQAVGQALKTCEERGWIAYETDPRDGRATLVRLTDEGHAAVENGRAVLRRIERVLEDELGAKRFEALKGSLEQVLSILSQHEVTDALPLLQDQSAVITRK